MMLVVLQVAVTLSWWVVPVVWLVMEALVKSMRACFASSSSTSPVAWFLSCRWFHVSYQEVSEVSGSSVCYERSVCDGPSQLIRKVEDVVVFPCDVAKGCLSRVIGGNQWYPLFLRLLLRSQCFFPRYGGNPVDL